MRIIELPAPPSANRLFINTGRWGGGGKAKSKEYKSWRDDGVLILRDRYPQPLGLKHCAIGMLANLTWKRDLDNILKPMLDLLQEAGEMQDDRYVCRIEMHRGGDGVDLGRVLIDWREASPPK